MNTKLIVTLLALIAVLSGCSNLAQVYRDRQALYAPEPLNEKVPPTQSAATTAYRSVLAKAQAEYLSNVDNGDPQNRVVALVETGIASANNNCREWFTLVTLADSQYEQGTSNLSLVGNAITATLGALQASYALITGYGIAATLVSGWNGNFKASVLGMADHDLQAKVNQIMLDRAGELRVEAPNMTFPQATDALSQYAVLCLPHSAKAAAKSALSSTVTTVTPSGALKSVAK